MGLQREHRIALHSCGRSCSILRSSVCCLQLRYAAVGLMQLDCHLCKAFLELLSPRCICTTAVLMHSIMFVLCTHDTTYLLGSTQQHQEVMQKPWFQNCAENLSQSGKPSQESDIRKRTISVSSNVHCRVYFIICFLSLCKEKLEFRHFFLV